VYYWLSTRPSSFLGHLGEGTEIAAVVDFAVWFAGLWGAMSIWAQARMELAERDTIGHWSNPLRLSRLLVSTTLCAVPFSYYALLGVMVLWNHSRLPESATVFAGSMVLSLAACSAVIDALYALVV
jgi:hypothetical protein